MAKGRKKIPTRVKELRGTIEKSRVLDNEMQVAHVVELPMAPDWLSDKGKEIWVDVTQELYFKQMLHSVDLPLIMAYCNEMSLYIETEMLLRAKTRVQAFKDADGNLKHMQAVPHQKIAKDALEKALKLATQFGLTPSARTNIEMPPQGTTDSGKSFNFFD